MKKFGSTLFKSLRVFVELLFAFISLYILIFLFISPFSIPAEDTNDPKTETIYLSTNGIHSDVILPIHHPLKDWEKTLNLEKGLAVDTFQTHLKFGWGDKNFFMKTKEWSDMEVGTVVNTVFGRGPGAMHLILCTPKDLDRSSMIELHLTKDQYRRLCTFIHCSFQFVNGKAQAIENHPYGTYDFFFDSTIEYNMTYTCNTWTNNALKHAGQKACVWTPFKDPIFSKY
ncbi:TIGR02117 family protein [Fluviicola chungangensis]|uniref:TIGR02117 family protein n=1 Tax=Fluviicola chungangensis TaxID=2597671 RepID=A0A556N1C2_9FLAO|nr:TIGR02117 family protein [Fluviicola chungangensis]TSJ45853.1 TIGR02117 family protein [Fluviicola chungangensis]